MTSKTTKLAIAKGQRGDLGGRSNLKLEERRTSAALEVTMNVAVLPVMWI